MERWRRLIKEAWVICVFGPRLEKIYKGVGLEGIDSVGKLEAKDPSKGMMLIGYGSLWLLEEEQGAGCVVLGGKL